MKKLAAQLLRVALLISVCSPALSQDCRYSSDRAANFTGVIKKVVIAASAGNLKITGSANAGVTAKGRACASSENMLGKITLESRREGEVVYLTAATPTEGEFFSFNRYSSLDLEIAVPKEAQLDINDTSGDIELSDVGPSIINDGAGDMLLKNVNGDLTVTDTAGEIRVVSVTGKIVVSDTAGNIDIEDARGDVKILTDTAGDIAISKVGGNAEVVNDTSGDITIREVKGNVVIGNDGAGDINVSDVGGYLHVNGDSSGNILHERVRGTVRIPART